MKTLDFTIAEDLLRAISWCFDPQKELTDGSPYKFTKLYQKDTSLCEVTAFAEGDTWLQRVIPCQAIITTELLVDGLDFTTRLGKLDVWRKSPIRISQTDSNEVSVERIVGATVAGELISRGNNLVNTFMGDLSAFDTPDIEWYTVGLITSECRKFKQFTKVLGGFTKAANDTSGRAAWIRLDLATKTLSLSVTERGSDRGVALCNAEVLAHVQKDIRFGIPVRHLGKIGDVVNPAVEGATIHIEVDDLDAPTRVRFSSDLGYIHMPIIEGFYCKALSQGAMGVFYGESYATESYSKWLVSSKDLSEGIELQTPKKGANRSDMLLEIINQDLILSKRSDIRRKEKSIVQIEPLEPDNWMDFYNQISFDVRWPILLHLQAMILNNCCNVDFKPIVIDHAYGTDASRVMLQYLAMRGDSSNDIPNDFDFEEDGDESKVEYEGGALLIEQRYNIKRKLWLTYISTPEDDYCRVALICATKEATRDEIETD